MGVKVIERKYKNQFYPSTQSTDWLLGNVGDWQRLEVMFEVTTEFKGTQTETISIDSESNYFKLNNGKKWSEYGFDIGDVCNLTWILMEDYDNNGTFTETPFQFNFTILNIHGDTLESSTPIPLTQFNTVPTDRGNVKVVNVKLSTDKEPEGLKFRYSHISNEQYQTNNLASFIDGTVTEFSFSGLKELSPGFYETMNPDGLQSGMSIENCKIQKFASNTGGNLYDSEFESNEVSGVQRLSVKKNQISFVVYPNNKIDACTIPMNLNSGTTEYHNVVLAKVPINLTVQGGEYASAGSQYKFMYNAQTAGNKVFEIYTKFKIVATNENSTSDKVSLVLLKYSSANVCVSRTELKSWSNASSLLNKTIVFNEVVSEHFDAAQGLILALEYFHIPQDFPRYIDVQFIMSSLKTIKTAGVELPSARTYKLTCDFMISSFFEDVSNLENKVAPSMLFNVGSLTDNFEIIIFPEWNNPNTVIKNDLTKTQRLGSTGWFNENFNGLDNNFRVESLKYYDINGNQVSQLDYAVPTFVEAVISGVKNLSDNSEFGLGFSWIPINESDYKSKKTPYHQNLLINTARKYEHGSFNLNENNGSTVYEGNTFDQPRIDIIAKDGVMFVPLGPDTVKMKLKFVPNVEFGTFFNSKGENDRKYLIWASIADHDLLINFSDRVSLILDYSSLVKNIPPAGPLEGMSNKFVEHPSNEDYSGVDKYIGHVEDDVLSRTTFNVPSTKFINSIDFGYEVFNTVTGSAYELEKVSKNTSVFPFDSAGVQQISIDEIRGFKLNAGNNKNFVKIKRDSVNDNDLGKAYKCFFATKIRWEDWISRTNVPVEFFNADALNNGYNNNWLEYLRKSADYKIRYFVKIDVTENGQRKVHKNTFDLTFNGYDENLNIQKEHKFVRDSDNTLLNIGLDSETGKPFGVILSNEPTRVEIIYTNLAGNFDFGKTYCVTSLEVDKGAGEFEYRQLSSVWDSENDNPLFPVNGETNLKMELISANTIKTTCLIDPNLLPKEPRFKITGRIGCFKEGHETNPSIGLYEELYEDLYE